MSTTIVNDVAGFISRTKPTTWAGVLTEGDLLDLAEFMGDRIAEVTGDVLALAWQAHRRWLQYRMVQGDVKEAAVPTKEVVLTMVAEGKLDPDKAARLLDGKPAEKRAQVRGTIMGYSATAVLRAMGAMGMSFEEAGVVLASYDLAKMSDSTIRIQLRAGKVGDADRGPPAPLTDSQKRTLRERAK